MSYRTTFREFKKYVGVQVGMASNNNQLIPYCNEAAQMLWNMGDWPGKLQRYRIRVDRQCHGGAFMFTWPTEVETIEAIEQCGRHVGMRNLAYEFIENALGNIDNIKGSLGGFYARNNCASPLMGDRQEVCTSIDVTPNGYMKIRLHSNLYEDDGAKVLIHGLDQYGQRVRTVQSTTDNKFKDGEILTFNRDEPPITINAFTQITGIEFLTKPRNSWCYLTQVDTSNGNKESWIGTYDHRMHVPVFRRSVLNGVTRWPGSDDDDDECDCDASTPNCDCNRRCITALVRMRFIPIELDTDFLQISNMPAMKNMIMALHKRDNGDMQNYQFYRQEALRCMDDELRQFRGNAPKKQASFTNREVIGYSRNVL